MCVFLGSQDFFRFAYNSSRSLDVRVVLILRVLERFAFFFCIDDSYGFDYFVQV